MSNSFIPHDISHAQKIPSKKPSKHTAKKNDNLSSTKNSPKTRNNAFVVEIEAETIPENNKETKREAREVSKTIETVDMDSYNIFHIDTIIKDKLSAEISNLPALEQDLKALLATIESNGKEKMSAKQQLNILRRRIRDIENTFALSYYVLQSEDILLRYSKLLNSENSRSFVLSDCDTAKYVRESTEKANLIAQFVSIAREYVTIENYRRVITPMTCPICGSTDIQKSIEEETSFICSCGVEIEILDDTPSFKDTDRVNMSSRYTYTRRAHFIDAMKKYQGKHNIDTESLQSVVQILLVEMKFHGLTQHTVTKDHEYMFLSEKRLCNHYEDINILHHMITGKPCPEFSHLENTLLELFEEQEKALAEIAITDKSDDRVNSMNVYYKLLKLLQKVGYPCKKGDFYILKTKAKEDEHDEKMRKAWNILHWEWIDTNYAP